MAAPETAALALAHINRIEDEIAELEAQKPLPGSMGAKYIEHLHQHRDLWEKFLGQ